MIARYRTHTTRIGNRLDTYQINAVIDAGWDYRLPPQYLNNGTTKVKGMGK
jgi:hypothetical protein